MNLWSAEYAVIERAGGRAALGWRYIRGEVAT